MVSFFKGNYDFIKCTCYRYVKLLELGVIAVGLLLEYRLCRIVTVSEMQPGAIPVKRTVDNAVIMRTLQEEYKSMVKEKSVYVL